ncbi:MAG TPA: PRC-barrel domain-containing protein [Armatimonadota bacterium]|nr:PRC-barrel domain-containing protein [Armatimonadota bacterium]
MREGSYFEIKPGMKVVGRDGNTLGTVREVIADWDSDIFIGLSVSTRLFVHPMKVPGERVERVRDGVVYVDAVEDDLRNYTTPQEKHHDTAEAYEGVTPPAADAR